MKIFTKNIMTLMLSVLLSLVAFSQPTYTLTDLGALPLDDSSEAMDINSFAQVVGMSRNDTTQVVRAFVWTSGFTTHLAGLGGTFDRALSINNSGNIVGLSRNLAGNLHAVLWQMGIVQDLGTLGGDTSVANSVNGMGQVTGWAQIPDGSQHAFLWQSGVMQDLGTFGGGYSIGVEINSTGQVAGFFQASSGFNHAFLWTSGIMQDLGTLPDHVRSDAQGMNDLAEIVGTSYDVNLFSRPFLWSNGVMYDLGLLPGAILGSCGGINNLGDIVGTMIFSGSPSAGFLRQDGVMYDLNDLLDSSGSGWRVVFASDINDNGEIVGNAINSFGQMRAVLLRPVPITQTFLTIGDTYIKKGPPNGNQGMETILTVQNGGKNRSLVQFDHAAIATAVGSRTVLSAKLRVYISTNLGLWDPTNPNVSVHRMLSSWAELGATWKCPNDTNTANNQPDGPQWEMDNSSLWPLAAAATSSVPFNNSTSGWIEWDVTADLQQFLNQSAPNFGWIIKKEDEGITGGVQFFSREGTNSPELVAIYQ